MKKLFLSILFLVASSEYITAQTITQKVTKEVCDCLNQTNIEGKDASTITDAFQSCFMKGAMPSFMELVKEMGIEGDFSKESTKMGREMGQKLAIVLIKDCPVAMTWFAKMSNKGQVAEENKPEIITFDGKFSGTFKGIKNNNYTFLNFKDASGDEVNLIWLQKFEGDELLLNDKESTLKAKNLQAKWRTIELYDYKTKKYQSFKEIVGLVIE